jgi:hypothetical protein
MRVLPVAGACLLCLVTASASLAKSQPGMVKVASGSWNGHSWMLRAIDGSSGSYCTYFSMDGRLASSGCGTIYPPRARSEMPQGLSWEATNGNPRGDYVLGLVVATATSVRITLSDGTVINTDTIAPPPGLTRKAAFYAAQKPCGPYPVLIIGQGSTGQIVAFWKRTIPRPPLPGGRLNC